MKILLVQPSRLGDNETVAKWKRPFIRTLTLPYLAALTPSGIDVEIVDDRVEDIDFDSDYDLIGITALTSQAPRAYQIADGFKRRGKKVVMGGIHATALPDEAIEHCDAVVIGEAEYVWANLLKDFNAYRLKSFYKAEKLHDLKDLPIARFELLKWRKYSSPFIPIQASRGCPHDCDFCAVSKFYGRSYRFRPIEDVLKEVKEVKKSGYNRFLFVDDNITANREYSKALFKALIPLKIRWLGQCTINIGRDEELCKLAAESGCYFMGIGIESIDQENLSDVNKGWNKVSDFVKLLTTIRKSGVGLVLNMIVGLDNDDEQVFLKTFNFLMESKAFYLTLNTPIPYPGTKLATMLEDNGRLLHKDWAKYVQGNIVYTPKRLTPEVIRNGYWSLLHKFFSLPSILKRSFGQSKKNLAFYFKRNLSTCMSLKKGIY